ncbi:MAG: hypothetical protein RDV41_05175 [Planctomycetota bacterium]|nr:hypothetical protein [Planctomycetota bacterium]
MSQTVLRIGNALVAVRIRSGSRLYRLLERTRRFEIRASGRRAGPTEAALVLHAVEKARPAKIESLEVIYDSRSNWRICRRANGNLLFSAESGLAEVWPDVEAEFDQQYRRCRMRVSFGPLGPAPGVDPVDPLDFPLSHILLAPVLAKRGAILLHAAGLVAAGGGLVLAGSSGSGKSHETARLVAGQECRSLNDEWVVIYPRGRRYLVSGTPWCAPPDLVASKAVPIKKMVFLGGPANSRARAGDAFLKLLQHAFVPVWDTRSTALIVRACSRVSKEVVCENVCARTPVDFRAPR